MEEIMILLSGYRRQDYNNSQLFIRQLQEIFAEFPPSVTAAVTSPLTGIQRHLNYPPVIGEIVKALEAEMEIFTRNAQEQQRLRIAREEPPDRSSRPTMEELLDRHPDFRDRILGRNPKGGRPGAFRPISEILAENGFSEDRLDLIPDAKKT